MIGLRKRKIVFLSVLTLFMALHIGSAKAAELPKVSNYDYAIDMFNTTYNITYDLQGGYLNRINNYTPENDDFDLGIPVKDGYTFVGWTGSNGNIPTPHVTVKKGLL